MLGQNRGNAGQERALWRSASAGILSACQDRDERDGISDGLSGGKLLELYSNRVAGTPINHQQKRLRPG